MLDFVRKRKVAVNMAPCGIGMCKSTNKKKLSRGVNRAHNWVNFMEFPKSIMEKI